MRRTVAVVGASSDRRKYGNKALRAFVQQGYAVYPVNPNEPEVEGLACVASVEDVAVALDQVTVYMPPAVLVELLPGIARKGCGELWLNPGTESAAVLERVEQLGLNAVQGCSILAVGMSPAELEG